MPNSIPTLQIDRPGLLTTVQDCGRHGYLHEGVPTSGAMDLYALQCANLLTGARRVAAALEITLLGPSVTLLADCLIALAGADLGAELESSPIAPWRSYRAKAGYKITFHRNSTSSGARAYLAVNAGLDVPIVLGSRSTYLPGKFGGHEGRPLAAGDILHSFPAAESLAGRAIAQEATPSGAPLRVVRGPEYARFTRASRHRFFAEPFTISQTSNRMGYRLEGRPLAFGLGAKADIITEAALFGSIQVTSDGLLLLLMADHQTTGGYARIATIVSADLSAAAQLAPGDQIRFELIDLRAAEALGVQRERSLRLLERTLNWGG